MVKTQSAEAAKAFYGVQLGIRLALEQDVPEWGGVQLSIVLGRFANVYQLGHKPGVQDIIASIGGASGSLIGLIGLAIAVAEVSARVLGFRGGEAQQTATSPYKPEDEQGGASASPGTAAA